MIADSNGDRSGDTRPLWITGLSPPDSWRSLRQPGYLQLNQVRPPKHCVWGYDRTLKVRNFGSTKVGNFQSQLTGAAARADRGRSAADPRRLVERVLPAHRLVQARRRPQGHDDQGHHAQHAPRRRDRPAAAEGAAGSPRADRLRPGHRATAVPAPNDPRRGPPARPAHCRARHPGREAVERVRRPTWEYAPAAPSNPPRKSVQCTKSNKTSPARCRSPWGGKY